MAYSVQESSSLDTKCTAFSPRLSDSSIDRAVLEQGLLLLRPEQSSQLGVRLKHVLVIPSRLWGILCRFAVSRTLLA